ncbi:autotransporter outer membrane beta-barrel domain-containing protein [Huaxiibacter chinensis]
MVQPWHVCILPVEGDDGTGTYYSDVWAQYNWYDNTLNGEQLAFCFQNS